MPCSSVYSTGTTISVRMVAKPSPNMIAAAMLSKKASASSGTMPNMVVMAAIETGRTRLTPDNADAWNQMGFSLRNLQQFDEALDAYEKALAIEPKHKGALEYLGELFLMTDQPDLARAQLQKLDDACFFSCKELKKLRKRIAAYEGGP